MLKQQRFVEITCETSVSSFFRRFRTGRLELITIFLRLSFEDSEISGIFSFQARFVDQAHVDWNELT